MSITPSIFSPVGASGPYTVVGEGVLSREQKKRAGLTIVLFDCGTRALRKNFFDKICNMGANEVVVIESGPCAYDCDALSRRYARLRFLIFSEPTSIGSRIDAAFHEALCNYVFVLNGAMELRTAGISTTLFSEIVARGRLCTVPVFQDVENEVLPMAVGPIPASGGGFDIQPVIPGKNEVPTLFPWDFCGVYNKGKHQAIGGFDACITQPWWQKLEYGMRAWLWGEEIHIHPALQVIYTHMRPPEDSSIGPGYRRFYMKILAPRHCGDRFRLPWSQWWAYLYNSDDRSRSAFREWKEIRQWVYTHRFRFVQDSARLIELWQWSDS